MKKLLLILICLPMIGFGQITFCEDFESLTLGDPIAQTSPSWNTWGELMTGTIAPFVDDAMINSTLSSSGSNSLYFPPTAAAGPEDVVLMFDPTLNITQATLPTLSTPYVAGDFIFSQMMYVRGGAGAYFNFQAENTPGSSWSLEVNFTDNGTSTGDILMSNTLNTSFIAEYPTNTWFEIKFEIDLSNNNWEVFIDGVLQGSFVNSINQIASLNLFPRINDEFYIDDVCYSYTTTTTTSFVSVTECDSYSWNGITYTTSGTYDTTFVLGNSNGYDSTATLNLTINPSTTSVSTVTECDTYTWNGTTYTSSGTYTYSTTNSNGCDSTATLNLTINYSSSSTDNQVACDTYSWVDGNTYTASNSTATHMFQTVDGCDSLSTLNLTINNSSSSTDTHVACDEFMWYCDGNTYTASNNTATYVYTNAAGCDSIVTLDLIINNSTSNTTTETACDSYTWSVDGNTYSSSGTYTDVSTNAIGCNHTETLELTINYSPNTTNILGVPNVGFLQIETYSVGQNLNSLFSWDLNSGGIILNGINTNSVEVQWDNNSGAYQLYVIETTQNGCSDTSFIEVNVNCLPTANSLIASACDSYTWAVNGQTYTTSGTYTDVSTNVDGCDHTETLELTINSVIASISQSGETLSAVTIPIGIDANWYNIQTENGTTRIWLMEEGSSTFMPKFDCSYFIVISDNGCTDTSAIYSYGANAARIGSFITSPNPTSGLINVKFENSKNQFVMFELISNNGSKLDEFITVDNNLNIDLSQYPSGTYYLYFNSEDAVQGCRLEEVQKVSTKIILNK